MKYSNIEWVERAVWWITNNTAHSKLMREEDVTGTIGTHTFRWRDVMACETPEQMAEFLETEDAISRVSG